MWHPSSTYSSLHQLAPAAVATPVTPLADDIDATRAAATVSRSHRNEDALGGDPEGCRVDGQRRRRPHRLNTISELGESIGRIAQHRRISGGRPY